MISVYLLLDSRRKTCAATPHRSPSPSEKSFLRGRKSITCSYLCSDNLPVSYFRASVGVFFL